MHELICSEACEASRIRDRTCVSSTCRGTLYHSHQENPQTYIFFKTFFFAFLAALGLCRCMQAFFELRWVGFSLWWLLVMELGLRRAGFGSCDFRALESGLNSCAAVKSLHAPRHVMHAMQGNRASSRGEGEVSWVFSSCGRHVGYILELRRGCPF